MASLGVILVQDLEKGTKWLHHGLLLAEISAFDALHGFHGGSGYFLIVPGAGGTPAGEAVAAAGAAGVAGDTAL